MAKYLVETYYNCTFKVSHYLDSISENEIQNLEKREDGKFEILDIKLDNRKTKNLDTKVLSTRDNDKEVNKIDITSSREHYDDMQTIVGNNVRTVPQIILNDKHVGGYGELEQYLNK